MGATAKRIFLLSPANCNGVRAGQLINPKATFELAARLREPAGAPIGELFAFISGLYFRGKLNYSRAFTANAVVITPSRGLLPMISTASATSIPVMAELKR